MSAVANFVPRSPQSRESTPPIGVMVTQTESEMHEAAWASASAPAELDAFDAVGDDIVSQKHTIRIFSPNRKQASSDAQDAAWAPAAPLCAPTQVGHDRTYYNRMVAEEMRKEWDAARCLVIDANEKVKSERLSGIAYCSLLSCSGDKRPMLTLEKSAEAIDVLAIVQGRQEETSSGRMSKSIVVCAGRR